LLAYTAGTAFGWYLGFTKNVKDVTELVIDSLIEGGYLRHRTKSDGEIEILKINED
jgi:hypothetical protein